MVRNDSSLEGESESQDGTSIPVASMVESIVGCKWSVRLLQLCAEGHNRPGMVLRACPGLSAKVMNERWRKMIRFGRSGIPTHPIRTSIYKDSRRSTPAAGSCGRWGHHGNQPTPKENIVEWSRHESQKEKTILYVCFIVKTLAREIMNNSLHNA